MELKAAEGKGSPRREIRQLKGRNHRNTRNNILESIARTSGGSVVTHTNEDGVVRMKLVVRKQELRQLLEHIKADRNSSQQPSLVEQRLNMLRKKHILRAMKGRRNGSWTPVLQSIPEEL